MNYIILLIALVAGLFVIWRRAGALGYAQDKMLDLVFLLLLATLFGARFLYLLLNHSLSLGALFRFPAPDLYFFGGLLTGILVFRGLIQYLDWDSLEVGDILVPGLFIIHGLMPLGCALSACTRETYWLESAFFLLVFYFVINLKAVFPGRSVLKGLLVYLYLLSTTLFYLILDRFAPILDWTDRFLAVAVFLLGMVGLLRYWNGLKSITREDLRLELTFRSRLKRRPLTMQNLPSVNMSLPRQFIKQMRYKLLHQEKKLEEEITLIEKEDPFKDVERAENNAELVAEAAEQSGHIFIDMQVKFMRDTLKMVQGALDRIRRGT